MPRSGKTTWSQQFAKTVVGTAIVNPDSIRLSMCEQPYIQAMEPFVWAIAKVMVKSLFIAGHHTVILDATNLTKARRDEWISHSDWQVKFKLFNEGMDVCNRRALLSNRLDLIPIIQRMWIKKDDLTTEELFDEIETRD